MPIGLQANAWGSVLPSRSSEAAEILEVPFDQVVQAAMLPVADTSGRFRKAPRAPVSEVLGWNAW